MSKRKKKGWTLLLVVLILALAAVLILIAFKQMEYDASRNYYEGLRIGRQPGRSLG